MRIQLKGIFSLGFAFLTLQAWGQFAPPAGQPGTTAMYKDSSDFVAWATGCQVVRGLQDASQPGLGPVTFGTAADATGKAGVGGVVSLGDGGMAVLSFRKPVRNGPGPDFAVFENGFSDTFLELAFVEVSSDSVRWVRFPSVSLTSDSVQVGPFDALDARKLDGLAGKYRIDFGVPFDLSVLEDSSGLDLDSVRFIRVVDVIGSLDSTWVNLDAQGNPVNDPWPTAFATGGFDLDAVGVIHEAGGVGIEQGQELALKVWPCPVPQGGSFRLSFPGKGNGLLTLRSVDGKICFAQKTQSGEAQISVSGLSAGYYLLEVSQQNRVGRKLLMIH